MKTVNGDGTYNSDSFGASSLGTFRWVASYSSDANNSAAGPTVCSEPAQATAILAESNPLLGPLGLRLLALLLAGLGVFFHPVPGCTLNQRDGSTIRWLC